MADGLAEALAYTHPMPRAAALRALIVEDHPLMRLGLADTLAQHFPGIRVDTAASLEGALKTPSPARHRLILLDLMLPGQDGLSGLARLRRSFTGARIVTLSSSEDPSLPERCVKAGAWGHLSKSMEPAKMAAALKAVLALEAPAAPRGSAVAGPTARQAEVLALLARGRTNKEISAELAMAPGTLKTHLAKIYQRLGARNRVEAVRKASFVGGMPHAEA